MCCRWGGGWGVGVSAPRPPNGRCLEKGAPDVERVGQPEPPVVPALPQALALWYREEVVVLEEHLHPRETGRVVGLDSLEETREAHVEGHRT